MLPFEVGEVRVGKACVDICQICRSHYGCVGRIYLDWEGRVAWWTRHDERSSEGVNFVKGERYVKR